jgi:hypothetical protein
MLLKVFGVLGKNVGDEAVGAEAFRAEGTDVALATTGHLVGRG